MKKIILAVLFIATTLSLSAEIDLGLSIKAGLPDYAGKDSESLDEPDVMFGLGVAGELKYSLTSNISLVGQVGYSYEHLRFDLVGSNYVTHKWHKIDFNVLAQAGLMVKNYKPFIMAGPRASYIMSAKYDVPYFYDEEIILDNSMLFGLMVEVGVIEPGNTSLGLGFKQDLSKFNDDVELFANQVYFFITF